MPFAGALPDARVEPDAGGEPGPGEELNAGQGPDAGQGPRAESEEGAGPDPTGAVPGDGTAADGPEDPTYPGDGPEAWELGALGVPCEEIPGVVSEEDGSSTSNSYSYSLLKQSVQSGPSRTLVTVAGTGADGV